MDFDFKLDFAIQKWPLIEQMEFEKQVGMTVYRAFDLLPDEGQEFDTPAAVIAGFAWISGRRSQPGLTYDEVLAELTLEGFLALMPEEVKEAPLVNRGQRRSTAKSAAPSATTSTTPRKKSAT